MKKPLLTFIIAADLVVIGGASFVLMNRLQKTDLTPAAVEEPAPVAAPAPIPPAPISLPPPEIKHRVLFTLKAPKARRVQITGDFNDGAKQDLLKNAHKVWTITIAISPGVYSYNYIVDGKRKIKDPNNPRFTPDHKSILTVKGNP